MIFKISLAGDLGSGKSTVAKILSEKFNAEIVSAGKIQRQLAAKLGLKIDEFNVLMESDRSYDKKLDDMLSEYDDMNGSFILDSRMSWYFVPKATSFYLKTEPNVAAQRVFNACRADESYCDSGEAYKRLAARRESEIKRYKEYYGQDITDMKNYDFVVDTTYLNPEQVAAEIEKLYFGK